jgi:hypothetical protein
MIEKNYKQKRGGASRPIASAENAGFFLLIC